MRELLPGIFVMWTARLRILFLFRLEHNDLSPRKLQRVRKELPAMGGIYIPSNSKKKGGETETNRKGKPPPRWIFPGVETS